MCGRFDQNDIARRYIAAFGWADAAYRTQAEPTFNAAPGTYRLLPSFVNDMAGRCSRRGGHIIRGPGTTIRLPLAGVVDGPAAGAKPAEEPYRLPAQHPFR